MYLRFFLKKTCRYSSLYKKISLCKLLLTFFILNFLNSVSSTSLYIPEADEIIKSNEVPVIKNVVYIRENPKDFLPEDIIHQTDCFVEREELLRKQYQIGQDTNIAQFALIAIYEDGTSTVFESFPNNCRGIFYMSGNQVVNFSQNKKPSHGFLDRQNVSWKENFCEDCGDIKGGCWIVCKCGAPHRNDKKQLGYSSIIQRTQPILEAVKPSVEILMNIHKYVENTTEFHKNLYKQAELKYKQIIDLEKDRDFLCERLSQPLMTRKSCVKKQIEVTNPFTKNVELIEKEFVFEMPLNPFDILINGVKERIVGSLKQNDFSFSLTYKDLEGKLFDSFIKEIVPKSLSQKSISETLNSKYFNLGCSEQLLFFDVFESKESIKKTIINFQKSLDTKKKIQSIFTQIHSTKTPCKTCLLCSCGHFNSGWLGDFNIELEKKLNAPVLTVISYHNFYKDEYKFGIPVISKETNYLKSLILLDARFK